MSAEMKLLAEDCVERQIDFDDISPYQGSTSRDKLVRAYIAAASPDAILKMMADRDALRKVIQAAVDTLNSGRFISSASCIHKDMLAALAEEPTLPRSTET